MSFLNRKIDSFCSKHRNFGIPNLIRYVCIITGLVYIFSPFLPRLIYAPALVLQGQIWQIFTFIFTISSDNIIFLMFAIMFAYYAGTALEAEWGTAKFNLFFFLSAAMIVVVGLIVELLPIPGLYYATGDFIYTSMIIAFAMVYPNLEVRFMMVIPLKMKWLAAIDVVYILFLVVSNFRNMNIAFVFALLAPVFIVIVFFWDSITRLQRRVKHKTSKQTVSFEAAQREAKKKKGYLHKCTICGKTDTDNPELDFRYCSKCNGYFCYCEDHINDHIHKE